MNKDSRRTAARDYRSRKPTNGICVVRCTATGEAWVGATTQPAMVRNSIWFQLRQGCHQNRGMQAAWTAHGEGAFTYEVIETFADDLSPHELEVAVAERVTHWTRALNAGSIR